MFEDTESSLSCVPSFGETFGWRKNDAREGGSTRVIKNTTQLSPSAFKVYNKISEKNRYVPRQWTQKEFEAALPERFKEKNKICFAGGNIGLITAKNEDEIDVKKDKEQGALSSEDSLSIPSLAAPYNPSKRHEMNEKISDLKAIFESVENKDDYDQLTSTNNGIQEIEESQAQVLLLNEGSPKQDNTTESEIIECEAIQTHCNTFPSFLNACLQCLLNIEQFVQILTNVSSRNKACSSFDIGKLQDLLNTVPTFNKSGQDSKYLYAKDVFLEFYDEVAAQSKSCDGALNILLETLIEKTNDHGTTNLRSVLQGKFCHATICEYCETVVREYETFIFLNPTSPPSSTDKRTLDINLFPCADGLWRITSRRISVHPGMKMHDLKEQLIGFPEFSGTCDTSSIQIGQVENSRLDKVFDDMQEITDLRLDPNSSLFAFQVMKSQPNTEYSDMKDAQGSDSRSYGFADMSYHLYFNCGLCLNDGKEVGLLMHRSCGGMICQDCLHEISQSNSDWELCPCPICERPIDMEKELCATKINAETEARKAQPDVVVCGVVFRANKPRNGNAELFGCPALVSIPQQTSGYQLYRCVGYLLPKALPMKEKTSFTLHKVDKTGLRCSSCSLATCTGCLIRIDDSVTIAPVTYLAVHFDDLTEKSKEDFEIKTQRSPQVSQTQVLFDGILRSCVDASSSEQSLCPTCFRIGKTTSSITEFPQLLVIHLNRQYANTGLPKGMTIADVERFFVLERENASQGENEQGLTYQLTAAVLGGKSSTATTYRPCLPGFSEDKWLLYDDFQVDEIDPSLLFLTSESVLFYGPTPTPIESSEIVGHLLKGQSTAHKDGERDGMARDSSTDFLYDIYCKDTHKRLATIAEDQATEGYPRKPSDFKVSEKQNRDHYKRYSSELEPGECFLGNDYDQNRPFRESDVVYGSQLSLGEIKEDDLDPSCKAIPGTLLDGIDTISPISTTDAWKNELRVVRETRKLVKAVKREEAYGIVCSLKKGADPCLLINDVSALHLAVGIKSDQRRSIIIYLLKYSRDVNVPTTDGTTPMHVAAAWGHQDALELLLAHGGDPFELTDLEGNSAFDLAGKDCSTFLQSVYARQRNSTRFLELSPGSYAPLPNHVKASRGGDLVGFKEKRLEDIVRSNVALPSFVEENTDSLNIRRRWIQRLRSFRERSSEILKSLRKMGGIRRRSRIGVMVTETPADTLRSI